MASQTELSHAEVVDSPDRDAAPPSPPACTFPDIAERCEQALRRVGERYMEARDAGEDDQAARLDWEVQVLRWKARRALDPDCEAPSVILESFESYPDHPALPEACLAGTRKGERFVWDHVLEGADGETIGERLKRRAARMRQVQIDLVAAIRAARIDDIHRLQDEEAELWLRRDEPRILHGLSGRMFVGDEISEVLRRLRTAREADRIDEIHQLEEEEERLLMKLERVCRTPGDVVEALYQLVDPGAVKPLPPDYKLPFDPVTGWSHPDAG